MPVDVRFGYDAVRKNEAIFTELGKRCLLVTSGSAAEKSGALSDAGDALERLGITCVPFSEITQNPTAESCFRAGGLARDFEVDFVVGIGGGSALDAAKAAAVYAANRTLSAEGIFDGGPLLPPLPVVLIGTTAGTGSEVTGVAVLTRENGCKKSVSGRDYYAKHVLADPRYTYSVPWGVTVSTALDALAHTAEGWFSSRFDETARLFGQKALPVLWQHLKAFYETGEQPLSDETRDALYAASLDAGMVLNACGTGFPHGMGYVLTEAHGLPHGRACAALLPAYVERGMQFCTDRAKAFFAAAGTNFPEFARVVSALADTSGVRMTDEQIARYCARWEGLKNFQNSPGGYSAAEAGTLLRKLFGDA